MSQAGVSLFGLRQSYVLILCFPYDLMLLYFCGVIKFQKKKKQHCLISMHILHKCDYWCKYQSDIKYPNFQTFRRSFNLMKNITSLVGAKQAVKLVRVITERSRSRPKNRKRSRSDGELFKVPGFWREGSRWVVGYTATLKLTYFFLVVVLKSGETHQLRLVVEIPIVYRVL